jgi:hypothetical protein
LNWAIDHVVHPITAWAEDKVLFPQPDQQRAPIADVARQVLKRVAPNLAAAEAKSTRMSPNRGSRQFAEGRSG